MNAKGTPRTQPESKENHVLADKDRLFNALLKVSHQSFSYLNKDAILNNFAEQIIQTGIFRSLMIALVDHEMNTIEVVRAFQSGPRNTTDERVKIINYEETCGTLYHLTDDNITPLTAKTGEIQIAETKSDRRLDARYEKGQSWDDKIAYFIPIKREEKVVAVLATGTTRKDKALFLERLGTLDPLFDQLGIALEHASLYDTALKNESRYRSLFENMQNGFAYHKLIVSKDGKPKDYVFLETNQAFEKLTGLKQQEILGKSARQVLPGIEKDPADWIGQYGQVALTGKPIQFENYSAPLNRWYSVSAYSPQKGYFVTLFADITQLKESQKQIVRLERLKALGELSAGVSHNLNNLLTGILLPTAMLKQMPLPDEALENVSDIFTSATRARDLVAQLNQSVRRNDREHIEAVDINVVVSEAIKVTRVRWRDESESKGIHIDITAQTEGVLLAKATSSGLHDVLINLIFNAIDALPNGGHIKIETGIHESGIQIVVQDNGIGMTPETQLRVFEPFFTTKMDVGTGLGLSTAYNQVKRWHGELTVEGQPKKGTTFIITLPPWTDNSSQD